MKAFQDYYPDESSYCYGCGRLNEHGLHIKSYWDGEESVARFSPQPHHMAIPGYVYGGLIASLIDCHGTGTAAAVMYRAAGREMNTMPAFRFVTGRLEMDFLKPTPLGKELLLRGRATEVKERKVWVEIEVIVDDVVCVRGKVLAVKVPASW